MAKAVAEGAKELDPVRDYDYEYRQGCVEDPLAIIGCWKKRSVDIFVLSQSECCRLRHYKGWSFSCY